MKQAEETNCTNWYMRKSGKKWIFGCSAVLLGLFLGGRCKTSKQRMAQYLRQL